MTALDACFAAYDAWRGTQPQLFWTYENLYGLDEAERARRPLRLVEPAGFTIGAEPRCAPTVSPPSAAPSATPNADGSAPLTHEGRDALPSKSARPGQGGPV